VANRIQLRRGTAASWASANPVLGQGEPGVESDTGKMKLGDGVTPWNGRPYASAGPQGPAGVASDSSVKDLITTPGSQTATALSATYATQATVTAAVAPKLDAATAAATYATPALAAEHSPMVAASNSLSSVAASRIAYEDGASVVSRWADLAGWQATDLQVSGGKAYRITTAPTFPSAVAPLPAGTGAARIRATITLPSIGTGAGLSMIGFWTGAVDVPPSASPTALWGIGIKETGVPFYWAGSANAATNLGAALAPGDYYVTAVQAEGKLSLVLNNADGSIERRIWFTAKAVTGVGLYTSDTRVLSGIGIGAVSARVGTVSAAAGQRAAIEGLSPSPQWYQSATNAQNMRIALPTNWDSRKPVPLVLYSHANNGTELDPLVAPTTPGPLTLTTALMANGYAVASSNQHGNNWGSPDAVADMVVMYDEFRRNYPLGPVLILAQSMGGVAALSTIAQKKIPGVRGFYGIFPVTNLRDIYNRNATYAGQIRTAFGIAADGSDYATKTAGYDPVLRGGADYAGVPMRLHHSAADLVVPKAPHADALAALVAPYVPESDVIATTGNHGDSTNFDTADMLAFFKRCVG
jgi:hypothetical protein